MRTQSDSGERWTDGLRRSGLQVVVATVALLWVVELADRVVFDGALQRQGIRPRHLDGLDGIAFAPFLHGAWSHLIANTVPFLVLGSLAFVVCRSTARWLAVSAWIVLAGGTATWLLARGGNHVGASGLIFGYLGFLGASALIERSVRSLAIGIVAAVLYGGMLWGLLPRAGLSWEGHLFGLAAGIAAPRVLPRRR